MANIIIGVEFSCYKLFLKSAFVKFNTIATFPLRSSICIGYDICMSVLSREYSCVAIWRFFDN